ncbi:MAG: DUF1573 domain-containing protein [Thermoanaerobaculia bacterium]|nr:DUF1573 domain-containing protein [Thermoanaerobaculia bacterium]
MHRITLKRAAICLLAVYSLHSSSSFADEAKGPVLSTPKTGVDLGTLTRGEVVVREIPIANDGDATLTIAGLTSSCACATVSGPSSVAPGETVQLIVTLDTLGLENQGSTDIAFTTNDPTAPSVVIPVVGVVKAYLKLTPQRLRWNTVQGEAGGMLRSLLGSRDGEDFAIVSAESPLSFLDVTYRPATEAERDPELSGSQWTIEAKLPGLPPVGPLGGDIQLTTDHPMEKRITINVSGFVRPIVQLTPPSAEFGEIALDGEKRSRYWFKAFSTEPIKVLEATTDVAGIAVETMVKKPGREYQFYLVFDGSLPQGPFDGTFSIRTDSEKVPLIEYPLTGIIVAPTSSSGR